MLTPDERRQRINRIRRFPAELEVLVGNLTEEQLMTEFIHGEWTVAQNVHHLADSHMNAFVRFKLLLTEENPTIRPYDQAKFAERVDSFDPPIQYSLLLLRGLHHRWVVLLESVNESEWARPGLHPANGPITVDSLLITYSDHCDAHIEQISRTLAAGKTLNMQ